MIWPKLFRRLAPYFAAGFPDLDQFDSWLGDDGDTITLVDPEDAVVETVTYKAGKVRNGRTIAFGRGQPALRNISYRSSIRFR
ncbi:hypothetical protein [Herbidospora cretacea]|uniref:hypothetical protein n=1 Tax=Herbidospora cretacea TaxID=28444 RepID=UPI0007747236|nr:hypothetical protein [Herbidospora cretacea]